VVQDLQESTRMSKLVVYYFLLVCAVFIAWSVRQHQRQRDHENLIYQRNIKKYDEELEAIWRKAGQTGTKECPASEAPGRVVPPEVESLAGGSPHGVGDERGLSRSIRQ